MTTDDERKAAIRELEREIPDAYVESASIGPTIVLTKKSAETALAALRQQGPITDAQVEAAMREQDYALDRNTMRAALEAARVA